MAHGELRGSICLPGSADIAETQRPGLSKECGRVSLPPSTRPGALLVHGSRPAGTERGAPPPARSLKNGVSWARPESRAFQNIPSRGHKAEDPGLPACPGFSLAGKGRCGCASVGYRVPVDPDLDGVLREGQRNMHRNCGCAPAGEHA